MSERFGVLNDEEIAALELRRLRREVEPLARAKQALGDYAASVAATDEEIGWYRSAMERMSKKELRKLRVKLTVAAADNIRLDSSASATEVPKSEPANMEGPYEIEPVSLAVELPEETSSLSETAEAQTAPATNRQAKWTARPGRDIDEIFGPASSELTSLIKGDLAKEIEPEPAVHAQSVIQTSAQIELPVRMTPEPYTHEVSVPRRIKAEEVIEKIGEYIGSTGSLGSLLSIKGSRVDTSSAVKELKGLLEGQGDISLDALRMTRAERQRLLALTGLRINDKIRRGTIHKGSDLIAITPMTMSEIKRAAHNGGHNVVEAEQDGFRALLKLMGEYSEE